MTFSTYHLPHGVSHLVSLHLPNPAQAAVPAGEDPAAAAQGGGGAAEKVRVCGAGGGAAARAAAGDREGDGRGRRGGVHLRGALRRRGGGAGAPRALRGGG